MAVAAGVVLAAGVAIYAVRADRYRLLTSAEARRCWDAVERLFPPTSSLRLASVEVLERGPGRGTEVVVGYRMDRVFAGLEREARCRFPDDSLRVVEILLDGRPVDRAMLDEAVDAPR